MMDEETLLSGLQHRDTDAFNRLFKELYSKACFFANKIIDNKKQAEDIAMDAFTYIWGKSDFKYNSFKQVQQYIFSFVYNAAVDYLKKQELERKHEPKLSYLIDETEFSLAEKGEMARYETERVIMLLEEIDKLPEKCREIVKMVYLDNLSRDRVAQKLGISINTVNHQCRLGVLKLRNVFSERDLLILFFLLHLSSR